MLAIYYYKQSAYINESENLNDCAKIRHITAPTRNESNAFPWFLFGKQLVWVSRRTSYGNRMGKHTR